MDEIDRKIIFYYLQEARVQQRKISTELNISPQVLKYRFDKLVSNGIIKKFVLHVNPAIYNKKVGFAAFKGSSSYNDHVFTEIKCLEELSIYGFYGDSDDEVSENIKKASGKLGPTAMRYIPVMDDHPSLNKYDNSIIESLRKNPRRSASEIAQELNLRYHFVKRRINYMLKKNIISIIPILDLSKTDIVLFGLFTMNFKAVSKIVEDITLFNVNDLKSGISICFSESLSGAKQIINKCREIDKNIDVMVIYEYDFYDDFNGVN
ncbi:winged helix-turn-helix transcriptional regulator [Picrophilus oshimae]|uniref:Hypothetical transcriptional regulatory protein n=1 Tax=Picrophilus torridus (strain ATCC 700027 / DSM 9790 / JCM 10055 / NBRC 100828 / KAW 2/3) TaxID=1122961 RepID=Q6L1J3_PICTO|nr:winged helix-turn-helix transcriptional regulator [Picrophilus oshimae]AAT43159.1 hypothetical transcriptional regulatory protein [Picrophilus oshimae DSM 9789]